MSTDKNRKRVMNGLVFLILAVIAFLAITVCTTGGYNIAEQSDHDSGFNGGSSQFDVEGATEEDVENFIESTYQDTGQVGATYEHEGMDELAYTGVEDYLYVTAIGSMLAGGFILINFKREEEEAN